MRAWCLAAIGSLLLVAGTAGAQEKPKIEKGPIARVAPADGKEMFASYCTPCHGKEGRGDGPAAPALKRTPADLTTLSARNGGTFPEVRVRRYIEGADEIAAHGSRDMPIWGPLFRSLSTDTAPLRVEALAAYLKTIQK